MECIADVIRYRTFTTKKGHHAGELWIAEPSGIPFKVMIWDSEQAKKPIPESRKVKLFTDIDFNMNGTLNCKW